MMYVLCIGSVCMLCGRYILQDHPNWEITDDGSDEIGGNSNYHRNASSSKTSSEYHQYVYR